MTAAAAKPVNCADVTPGLLVAAKLRQWVETAEPGDETVYHRGSFLPQSLPVVIEAKALVAAGEVIPVQRRLGAHDFEYRLVKRRNVEARPLSAAAVRTSADERAPGTVVEEESEWLLSVLRRLASFGHPCPTNAELARMAMLKDAESVRYRLGLLQIAGRIAVETPPQGPRVVTIISSGKRTGKGGPR